MEFVKSNLFDHPAMIAWRKIETSKLEPEGIEILQKKKGKATIYRLCGVGPNKAPIIAKLCRRIEASRERIIYEKVLPRLPFPSLHFYGFVNEDNLDCGWLFLEDVEGDHFSVLKKRHHTLTARWLALMHTSAAFLTERACLRSIGLDYYFGCLKRVQSLVMSNLSNPAFTSDEVAVLNAVLLYCEIVESNWNLLDSLCKQVPQTLVHCSFRKDNMRVFSCSRGDSLMVFDSVNLCYDWVTKPMKKMKKHKNRLDKFTKALWRT
jgi:hypothetical protein